MSFVKTILSSYKNIHFQSLLGNAVMALFGMATVAVLYRALSFTEIGTYVFFMMILGLIDTFRSGFLTNAFIKFYSGTERERADEVAGSAWCLSMAITSVSVILNLLAFLTLPYIENQGMILFLKYFSLISLATLPSFMANLVVQGDKRFDRLLWLRLINQTLFTSTVVVLTILGKSTLNSIVTTYVFTNLIASLSSIALGWTKITSIKRASKSSFIELFHFGKYCVGSSVSSNLFKVTDTFFINFFLGPAALAVYNLGGRLMQIIEIPLLSFASSGISGLSAHYNNDRKEEMMYVMKKMVGLLSLAFVVVAVISVIFAEPIIAIIGGEKYIDTAAPNIFRIFMGMAILYPADRFFALTLDVIHLPRINFYKLLVMLCVNLLADYIGVLLFKSPYAIAVANIFPVLVAIIIAYIPLNKYAKFSFWSMYVIGYKEAVLLTKGFLRKGNV